MSDDREQNLDKFQLSLYLTPFLGPILAGINLASKSQLDDGQRKISRLSLRMGLIWLLVYTTLWLGGNITSDIWAMRMLYLNGVMTTTYFLTCLLLFARLWSKK